MLRKFLWVAAIALVFGAGVFGGRGANALVAWITTPPTVAHGDRSDLLKRADAERVLFSLSTCPFCKQARAWLKDHQVSFKELVIDTSPAAQRLFDELKEQGLPVLVTQDRLIRGFAPEAYAETFAIADVPKEAAVIAMAARQN
jgi:glutaredoxin 3